MPSDGRIIKLSASDKDLARCRAEIQNSAAALGFHGEDLWGVVSAVFEACVNAVTHGKTNNHCRAYLSIRTSGNRFEAIVSDSGCGFTCPSPTPMPSPKANRGRGIPLMKMFMDEVKFDNSDGCKVTLIKYLPSTKS
jgi:serine/threonine-protein kinase RsbW